MSGISVGAAEIAGVSVGSQDVVGVSVGTQEVWTAGGDGLEREPPAGEFFEWDPGNYYWTISETFGHTIWTLIWDSETTDPGGIDVIAFDATEWTDPATGWTYHRGTYYPEFDAYAVYRTRPVV